MVCSGCTSVIGVLVALALIAYTTFKWIFSYWDRRNVPTIKPSIPFGNIGVPFFSELSVPLQIAKCYKQLKAEGNKYGGFYLITKPAFLPLTNDIVKNIMLADFGHFVNRGFYFNEKDDPLSAHLFAIEDEKWKSLRAKLTPTFTSGKMKMMFPTLVDCATPLIETIGKLDAKREPLDIKELVACFTTDVIGSCAFGIECNSFKNPDAEFRHYGKLLFTPNTSRVISRFFSATAPNLARKFGLLAVQKDVSNFFLNMIKQTVEYREKKSASRKDFMQLLIELKNSEAGLSLNEISAQAFVFFIAGFETSSTGMTFCLYELSKNMEIQDKIREEIERVLEKHGELTYEAIQEMKYLDQVVKEALRKYPPVPVIPRVCTKPYKVPGTDITLEKDEKVFISVFGLQHDPEYFPEPRKFDPERFSEENKDKVLPYTYLPFGEGPRVCIGLRFGVMQMKVGLISILKNFRIRAGKNTPEKLKINPNIGILCSLETIYLDTEKIK